MKKIGIYLTTLVIITSFFVGCTANEVEFEKTYECSFFEIGYPSYYEYLENSNKVSFLEIDIPTPNMTITLQSAKGLKRSDAMRLEQVLKEQVLMRDSIRVATADIDGVDSLFVPVEAAGGAVGRSVVEVFFIPLDDAYIQIELTPQSRRDSEQTKLMVESMRIK